MKYFLSFLLILPIIGNCQTPSIELNIKQVWYEKSKNRTKILYVEYEIVNNTEKNILFDKAWVHKSIVKGRKQIENVDDYSYMIEDKFIPFPEDNGKVKAQAKKYVEELKICNPDHNLEGVDIKLEDFLDIFLYPIPANGKRVFNDYYQIKTCKKKFSANYVLKNFEYYESLTPDSQLTKIKSCLSNK